MNTLLPPDELLSAKELAARLKRSESYIKQMKRRGFPIPAGRTTLRAAMSWLARNPRPFVSEATQEALTPKNL